MHRSDRAYGLPISRYGRPLPELSLTVVSRLARVGFVVHNEAAYLVQPVCVEFRGIPLNACAFGFRRTGANLLWSCDLITG